MTGMYISVNIRESKECPHCGQIVPGDIVERLCGCGDCYYPLLKEIGYGDEQFLEYVTLSEKHIKSLYHYMRENYCYGDPRALLDAIERGLTVELKPGWV